MGADVLHISPLPSFPPRASSPCPGGELLQWSENGEHYIVRTIRQRNSASVPSHAALAALDDEGDGSLHEYLFPGPWPRPCGWGTWSCRRTLMAKFRENLGFYGCTVSASKQYTLARFLSEGILKSFYQPDAEKVTAPAGRRFGPFWKTARPVRHPGAGGGTAFFLLRLETPLSDEGDRENMGGQGIRVRPLSGFYRRSAGKAARPLVILYASLPGDRLEALAEALSKKF